MTSPIVDREESTGGERARGWVVAVAAVVGIVGLWLMASAFLFVAWMVRDAREHARSHALMDARSDAQSVQSCVEIYLATDPHAVCPTLAYLVSERFLSVRTRTQDPWGHDFDISCVGGAAIVTSAGPDGTFRTSDDVR